MVPWWRWYYYVNPIAWTLYGIIVTQLGQDTTVVRAKPLSVRRNLLFEAHTACLLHSRPDVVMSFQESALSRTPPLLHADVYCCRNRSHVQP